MQHGGSAFNGGTRRSEAQFDLVRIEELNVFGGDFLRETSSL
jgi:hypothetical protein